jgi:hypothetical protein
MGDGVRSLIGHEHPAHVLPPFAQLAEKLRGDGLPAPVLDQDVKHSAFLIDGPPERGARLTDSQEYWVIVACGEQGRN